MDSTTATIRRDPAARLLLAGTILLISASNLLYLELLAPIDLSGDEAQYWEWSQRLDLSYYSKGPLVAYVIRASTEIFGDSMLAVRLPANLMYAGATVGVYALARTAFRSERVALTAAVFMQLSPMFVFYSLAMTIDTPMVLCWTWASYFAYRAVFQERKSFWLIAGALIGIGFLAKYAAMIWWLGVLMWAIFYRQRVRWSFAACGFAISLLCTLPVWVWNARHDWVSFRHVARQTGATGGSIFRGNFLEFLGSQIGAMNPALFVIAVAAVVWAIRGRDARATFLAAIGVTFFALTAVVSFFAKVQANWPGPAYVTLLVLAAGFAIDRPKWRGVVALAVVIGLGAHLIGREPAVVLWPLKAMGMPDKKIAWIDGVSRLRGWRELGQRVGAEAENIGGDAFILCDHYMQTALMRFYVPGRPRTFYAGSYFTPPSRMTQYDLWDDCRLDRPDLIGRNAIYVGKGGPMPAPLPAAFERVERLPEIPVYAGGVVVETFKVWRCWGFKGLSKPATGGHY